MLNPVEMAMADGPAVEAVLKSIPGYAPLFKAAFPGDKEPITYDNVAKAIGAFERTLVTPSRFDAYLAGKEDALTAAEKQGLETFIAVGCTACHLGEGLGGGLYQKYGLVKPVPGLKDEGRGKVSKNAAEKFFFKVLRVMPFRAHARRRPRGVPTSAACMFGSDAFFASDAGVDAGAVGARAVDAVEAGHAALAHRARGAAREARVTVAALAVVAAAVGAGHRATRGRRAADAVGALLALRALRALRATGAAREARLHARAQTLAADAAAVRAGARATRRRGDALAVHARLALRAVAAHAAADAAGELRLVHRAHAEAVGAAAAARHRAAVGVDARPADALLTERARLALRAVGATREGLGAGLATERRHAAARAATTARASARHARAAARGAAARHARAAACGATTRHAGAAACSATSGTTTRRATTGSTAAGRAAAAAGAGLTLTVDAAPGVTLDVALALGLHHRRETRGSGEADQQRKQTAHEGLRGERGGQRAFYTSRGV